MNRIWAVLLITLLFVGVVGESQMIFATEINATNTIGTTGTTGNIGKEELEEVSIKLNKTEVKMTPATTVNLKLKGAEGQVRWSSEDKKIATVTNTGKVTAKAKGTVKIKAICQGVTYTCMVTVNYQTYTTKDGMEYRDEEGNFGYTGRWFPKCISGGKYYFTNTDGSAIYFKVTGSKYVNVNFVSKIAIATPYFAYSVDGKSMKRQPITKKKINVGNTKTHYVRLVIDSMSENEDRWAGEAGVGIRSIKPITKTGVVTAIKPRNKSIAFYGDSITQGVRALGMALDPTDTSATHSYAWYCADKLNMVPYYVGYGGSGIIEPGSFNNCTNAISHFSAARKVSKISPDVIVIEHGTNDVKTDATTFTNKYREVLQQLHKQYPKAQIMAIIPFTGLHTVEIRMAASGYKWCTVVETASWKISYTDGLHPNTKGAKLVGKNLAKKIKSKIK